MSVVLCYFKLCHFCNAKRFQARLYFTSHFPSFMQRDWPGLNHFWNKSVSKAMLYAKQKIKMKCYTHKHTRNRGTPSMKSTQQTSTLLLRFDIKSLSGDQLAIPIEVFRGFPSSPPGNCGDNDYFLSYPYQFIVQQRSYQPTPRSLSY